jgi:hypothetical protein
VRLLHRVKVLRPLLPLAAAFGLYGVVSLPHLADGPIGTHGWRQAIATSVARLYAQGQPFLYPRAEGCGAEPGLFMGMEFPLYAYLMGKLGGASGINLAGRLLSLASALMLMLGIFGIARFLFERWREPLRSLCALGAAGFISVSPLFRFYGISFVPDVHAHAWVLFGIALLSGPIVPGSDEPRPVSRGRFLCAALLIALGCLTKLIALPHLALAGFVLLSRARSAPGARGLLGLRGLAHVGLLAGLVGIACFLWYVRWNRHLKSGGCDLVWLPDGPDDTWKTMTFTDPEWRFRMSKWGREDLLGSAWALCLAGIPLALFAGARGALFLVWALACGAGFVRLGWHTKQHDYDFLLVLPCFAIGFGVSLSLLGRALARVAVRARVSLFERRPAIAVAIAVAAGLIPLAPHAHRQSRRHFYTAPGETETQEALDKVLPANEPIHYFGGKNDPRIPYFAARRAWGTEPWLYCQQKEVKYDCVLAVDTKENLAPCLERGPSVAWADRSLVCGIRNPETPLSAPRLLDTLSKNIAFPALQDVPGVGRILGTDVATREGKRFVDLYVIPDRANPQTELLLDSRPIPLRPPPAKWLAGSIIVARAELGSGSSARLALRAGAQSVPLRVR